MNAPTMLRHRRRRHIATGLTAFAVFWASASACAAAPDASALIAEINRIAARTDATVGVSVRDLDSDTNFAIQGEMRFPMASTYKLAIAAYALHLVDGGRISLQSPIQIEARQRSTSSVVTHYLPHAGIALSLHNLLELMLTQSDNTATDVILDFVGGPQKVTSWLREIGIADMRVDRSTAQILRQYAGLATPSEPGVSWEMQFATMSPELAEEVFGADGRHERYLAFERDPQDQATVLAMDQLLTRLWRDSLLTPARSQVLRDILSRSEEPVRLGRRLPAGTPLAHKTGTLTGTINDVGVLTLPDGRQVVICVYFKNAPGPQDPHESAIGDIARAVYDYFVLFGRN